MSQINTNLDIDFLPQSYREAGVQRKNWTLRVTVVCLFAAIIGGAAVFQQYQRHEAQRQLAELLPQYELASARSQQLTTLQAQLAAAERRAELCTYLRHPWPRSQILGGIAELLPDSIQLVELKISPEQSLTAGQESGRPMVATAATEAEKPGIDPATRDLNSLREMCDKRHIVVTVTGITQDAASLNHYLERLGRHRLFEKVNMGPVERIAGDAGGKSHFSARLLVRPGYGQPNGPAPKEASGGANTRSEPRQAEPQNVMAHHDR